MIWHMVNPRIMIFSACWIRARFRCPPIARHKLHKTQDKSNGGRLNPLATKSTTP